MSTQRFPSVCSSFPLCTLFLSVLFLVHLHCCLHSSLHFAPHHFQKFAPVSFLAVLVDFCVQLCGKNRGPRRTTKILLSCVSRACEPVPTFSRNSFKPPAVLSTKDNTCIKFNSNLFSSSNRTRLAKSKLAPSLSARSCSYLRVTPVPPSAKPSPSLSARYVVLNEANATRMLHVWPA